MTLCDSAKRHFLLLCAAIYLVVALVTFGPALGSGAFVFGTDTYSHDYIMHLYGWDVIKSQWAVPLWCPFLFCGLPFLASFAHCPFYPSQLLYFLLPFNSAFTMQYVLAVAMAGWFVAIWLRGERLGRIAALLGGLAFMYSGHFLTLTYAGHLQKMIAIAWAPLALWSTRRILRSRGIGHRADEPGGLCRPDDGALGKPILVLGLSIGMQLLASHAQIAYATVWACLILALLELAVEYSASARGPAPTCPEVPVAGNRLPAWMRSHARWLGPAAGVLPLAGALIFALALSAIQVLPGAEMSSVSNRAQGVTFKEATETSYPPAELAEYLVSGMFGSSVRGSKVAYFGSWGERIVSDYLGAPLLILSALGLVLGRGRCRLLLGGFVALSLVVGLGRHTPVYWLLFKMLPGFASFRSPGTFMFLADLALVGLAATGLQAIVGLGFSCAGTSLRERPGLLGLLTAGCVTGILAVLLGLQQNWNADLSIATPEETQHYHVYRGVIAFGRELSAASLAVVVGLWICCRGRLRGQSLPPQLVGAVLGLFAVGFPVVHNRQYLVFEPLAGYLEYLRFQPAYSALEKAKGQEPLRVLEERALKNDGILHSVGIPTGYHPVILGRYDRLMQVLGYATERFGSLFYLQYAHTYGDRAPGEEWGLWQGLSREAIWKRKEPGPAYATGPARVHEGADVQECALLLRAARLTPHSDVVVEKAVLEAAGCRAGPQQAQAELVSWQPRRVLLKTYAQNSAIVPVAEVHAPGWKASSDKGESVRVIPVNIAQRALVVPAGARFVTMRYDPFSYRLGAFLSLLALGMTAAVGASRAMMLRPWAWRPDWVRGRAAASSTAVTPVPSPAPEEIPLAQHDTPTAAVEDGAEEPDKDQRYWDVGL